MSRFATLIAATLLLLGACIHRAMPPVEVKTPPPAASYLADVEPILEKRCVVCHSCYNAPCQLKLSSYEGLDRGGSKAPVYSGSRLRPQAPTRLFIDAQTTGKWRTKKFHSVTDNSADPGFNISLMLHLLDAKMRNPRSTGDYHPEATDLTCAANTRELSTFLDRHPERGMPFGFPPLTQPQYATLAGWLQRDAKGPTPSEQSALIAPSPAAARAIAKWETFLNPDDPKHAMTARYLYEHFFLAHLHFAGTESSEFYEMVRSATPPGEPISVIATLRPYDHPGVDSVYYRFRKIHSTIVHKTHMVVQFSDGTLKRFQELFIDTPWLEPPHVVAVSAEAEANPFRVYAQIPAKVRYQFLLDHSEYFVRTFIRGPVCKGQIALNVIHDHFWAMFLDPDADLTVKHPEFLVEQAENLRMPTEQGSREGILRTFSDAYRERYVRFYRAKSELYDAERPDGLGLDAIWKGERASDSPVLTIYRHFDSASVHKGVLGGLPRTMWVIDYPQLERIYYNLVAGFDVFGNVSHQVNVRRYMDYLRIEGELNFLGFLPKDVRLPTLRSWYVGDRAIENVQHQEVLTERGTKISYRTADPKREFIEKVVDGQILKSTGIEFDDINYRRGGREAPPMPESFTTHEDILNGFRALTAPGTGFIRHVNGFGANVLYVRVNDYEGRDRFFSIVINRWHDNVNSLFGEAKRLDSSKDTIDFLPLSIGSYPNYFFDLNADDIPDFFDMLENFDGTEEYEAKVRKYGVNRADANFWDAYDWFQQRLDEADPLQAGRYDLNRYYAEAAVRLD
jgi:hypothetical protein